MHICVHAHTYMYAYMHTYLHQTNTCRHTSIHAYTHTHTCISVLRVYINIFTTSNYKNNKTLEVANLKIPNPFLVCLALSPVKNLTKSYALAMYSRNKRHICTQESSWWILFRLASIIARLFCLQIIKIINTIESWLRSTASQLSNYVPHGQRTRAIYNTEFTSTFRETYEFDIIQFKSSRWNIWMIYNQLFTQTINNHI